MSEYLRVTPAETVQVAGDYHLDGSAAVGGGLHLRECEAVR
jgi:hypothetical protein